MNAAVNLTRINGRCRVLCKTIRRALGPADSYLLSALWLSLHNSYSRCAASASEASSFNNEKNAADCPMKSPMLVRKLTTLMATPFVSVGRMIEQTGRLELMNGHGSGIIRLV